jgi:hypothetical protein
MTIPVLMVARVPNMSTLFTARAWLVTPTQVCYQVGTRQAFTYPNMLMQCGYQNRYSKTVQFRLTSVLPAPARTVPRVWMSWTFLAASALTDITVECAKMAME